MKRLLLLITICISLVSLTASAQIQDGSIAPDFTVTDINSNTHNLYTYLDQGYTVIICFSATWVGPVWSYHQVGALQDLWLNHGPLGGNGVSPSTTDDLIVLWIESDQSTTLADLNGTSSNTQGDYITGTDFIICDDHTIGPLYQLGYYPYIVTICPNRIVNESGQASSTVHYSNVQACPVQTGNVNPALLGFIGDTITCAGSPVDFNVVLQNMGALNLTSVTLEVSEAGTPINTVTWAGNLATYGIDTVSLGSTVLNATTTYSIGITSADDDVTNNTIPVTIHAGPETAGSITIDFTTDEYPDENYITVTNSSGVVIWEEGNENIGVGADPTNPLSINTAYSWDVYLPAIDCYEVKIHDNYGDGVSYWNGSYAVSDNLGTVIYNPVPNFGYEAVISIKNTLACDGSLSTSLVAESSCFGANDGVITAQPSGGVPPYTYSWSNGMTSQSITNLVPMGYTVDITDVNGCLISASGTVSEDAQITLDVIGADLTCSISEDGTATASIVSGGVGTLSYLWSDGQSTTTATGLNSGQHSITVTDQNGCQVNGSTTLGYGVVDYALAITATPTTGPSPLLVTFDNQTPNPSLYNFTWAFGDGVTEQNNASFVQHTYFVDGLWDVVLIAEDINTGCTDTLYKEDYIFTTGGTSCTHTATINQTGPLSFCQGDSVLLTCNTNSTFTYQWNLNGASINGATNDSLYVTQSGNYSVTIYESNCPVVSSSITINVNSLPNPIISSVGSIIACSGGSVTMDAGGGYLSYDWSSGGSGQFETVTASGNYTVTVLGSNGCYGTSVPYVVNGSYLPVQEVCIVGIDSASNFNRVIWEKPIISGIDSFYVYRESTVANVYEKIGAVDYNDTALFVDQNSNPSVQAYRYKLSSLDTCGSETPLGDFHKTIHLTINQGVGQTWNLIWNHYEGFAFGSYNIYRGTDPNNMVLLTTIASNLNSYTDLTPPGGLGIYYQIEVVSSTPCNPLKANYNDSRSNIAAVSDVGIETLDDLIAVSIYPNPAKSVLNIELEGDFEYTLIDARGRLLMTEKGNDTVVCDISSYESGVYFVTVSNSTGAVTQRIVKK